MIKVLIVDDEPIVRRGIVEGVDWKSMDCVVVGEASNGKEGMAAVSQYQPDLIISDIRMPQMDGLEMLVELRRNNYKVHAILLTAYSDFEYVRSALKLGAVDYLLKPFSPEELEKAIAQIRQRNSEQTVIEAKDILPNIQKAKSKYVKLTISYIMEHYREPDVNIAAIAKHLFISESHLSHIFRKETNHTVISYLTHYRMHKAMCYLKEHQYKVYEVAEMVGYKDLAYFGSKFKKIVGVSPSDYQKQWWQQSNIMEDK